MGGSPKLGKGKHVLMIYSLSGDMNYDYLEFTRIR